MKRILSIICISILAITMMFGLGSCGNQRLFDIEADVYNYIHDVYNGKCYAITSWKNNNIGIKVVTRDYGNLYFSEGTYILVSNYCPICGNHKEK